MELDYAEQAFVDLLYGRMDSIAEGAGISDFVSFDLDNLAELALKASQKGMIARPIEPSERTRLAGEIARVVREAGLCGAAKNQIKLILRDALAAHGLEEKYLRALEDRITQDSAALGVLVTRRTAP